MRTTDAIHTEKFAATELNTLRDELMQSGLDFWQAGELVSSFLAIRGYGISKRDARVAACHIEAVGCSIQRMQEEFERLARFM